MRRADRLFSLIQLVRGKRFTTARRLADQLEVSLRTVYRDVADLQRQGVPIEGEAGVGYRMGRGFDLPPLMFTHDEARSVAAAARIAQQWLDPALARGIQGAMSRIMTILPATMRVEVDRMPIFSPPWGLNRKDGGSLQTLREAAQSKQFVTMAYVDQGDKVSRRTVRPLGCFYWGKVWTLVAWCDMRQDFRSFRIDRIASLEVLASHFTDEVGKSLQDMLHQQRCWQGADL